VNAGNAPSLTVDALRGEMATHRRGLRPAQWPVRNLLGDQRSGTGGLRDPRLYAAVGGLLACGAAATVAFTAGDGGPGRDPGPGPMALPAPGAAAPPPTPAPPAPADPVPSDPGGAGPAPPRAGDEARSAPVPQAWRGPVAPDRGRSTRVRELADRLAAELVGRQGRSSADGTVDGLLVVPLQREADGTVLVKRVRIDARCAASPDRPGRHRAWEPSDEDRDRGDRDRDGDDGDRDRERTDDSGDRDDRDRDGDRDRDRDGDDRDEDDRDRDGGDGDDGDDAAPSTRAAAHPAMATVVTPGDDRPDRVQVRHIDAEAMLAALGDLESDGAV
jgi:hypothetical protein